MLHKEIPFLRIGLPLCAGIISGLFIKPDTLFLLIFAVIVSSGLITTLTINKFRDDVIYGYFLTISLYLCGLILYTYEVRSISTLDPEQSVYSCTLSDIPEEKENSYRLNVKLNSIITEKGNKIVKGSLVLYTRKDISVTSLLPGDHLIIRCTPLEIVNRGNPKEFNYRLYMINHGFRYYAFISKEDILSHNAPGYRKLVHRSLIIREKIIGLYRERGISGDRLALVAAITLGQKKMLDPEQKNNFIRAGVMHIMAVSGLHAVILSLFVFNLLFFMKRKYNLPRVLITILILWSFAFVTGLTSSVLRATLMFSFLQAGYLMKRRVNGINSVLASAFILILLKPSVIFDAGFLLSYSAVIYLVSFYQDFYRKLHFRYWLSDKIWQSVVVTLVAQAGTMPLTIMLFNRFPAYFIISNVLIVPVVSLLIILGCLVPLLFPFQILSHFFASLLNFLAGQTDMLTTHIASLPHSSVENIGMTTLECILLSSVIFIFSLFLLKKKYISIYYPLTILTIYLAFVTILEISTKRTNELIVYNIPGSTTIGVKTGKIMNIYSDTDKVAPDVLRHCSTMGLKIRSKIINKEYTCLRAGSKTILIASAPEKNIMHTYMPDILILTGPARLTGDSLAKTDNPFSLIVVSAVAPGTLIQLKEISQRSDTVHLVRLSGAFTERL